MREALRFMITLCFVIFVIVDVQHMLSRASKHLKEVRSNHSRTVSKYSQPTRLNLEQEPEPESDSDEPGMELPLSEAEFQQDDEVLKGRSSFYLYEYHRDNDNDNLDNHNKEQEKNPAPATPATPTPDQGKHEENEKQKLWRKLNFRDKERKEFKSYVKTEVTRMTHVLQDACLPKLVCEIYASLTSRGYPLTSNELNLMAYLRETGMGVMAMSHTAVSKLHFAGHMGQLLSGMEGTGCYNFYPKCPLTRPQVLRLAKNVRIVPRSSGSD